MRPWATTRIRNQAKQGRSPIRSRLERFEIASLPVPLLQNHTQPVPPQNTQRRLPPRHHMRRQHTQLLLESARKSSLGSTAVPAFHSRYLRTDADGTCVPKNSRSVIHTHTKSDSKHPPLPPPPPTRRHNFSKSRRPQQMPAFRPTNQPRSLETCKRTARSPTSRHACLTQQKTHTPHLTHPARTSKNTPIRKNLFSTLLRVANRRITSPHVTYPPDHDFASERRGRGATNRTTPTAFRAPTPSIHPGAPWTRSDPPSPPRLSPSRAVGGPQPCDEPGRGGVVRAGEAGEAVRQAALVERVVVLPAQVGRLEVVHTPERVVLAGGEVLPDELPFFFERQKRSETDGPTDGRTDAAGGGSFCPWPCT